nr:helix-turn-helix domain-containing protein [Rhizobium sp. 57MFTsu3.2]
MRYHEDDLPASQIAWLHGFHQPSSFSHPCRCWTGKCPLEYRRSRIEPSGVVPGYSQQVPLAPARRDCVRTDRKPVVLERRSTAWLSLDVSGSSKQTIGRRRQANAATGA